MNYQEMRRVRKEKHITQQRLADVLSVNRATISKYETGVIEPPVQQLLTISGFLGISLEKLAGKAVSDAYEEGVITGSEDEEWKNINVREFWKQEYGYTGSDIEIQLISAFSRLNSKGQQKAMESVEIIAGNPDYQKEKEPPQPE